ncbi:sugar-binding protein [Desulfuromonas acetoxidans]|uniref:sugar-binding protein n=1 Tax=Desulfuromonas acetoxidans TaxID=891 RepID=UPI00292F4864|nr:sugar-binding protein [Desulfuromonas acetoxidans]
MNLVKGLQNLLGVSILLTLLAACSNGSSHRTTTETTFPFGAEEVISETDYDGDGHWDTRTIYSFVYNEDLQVTEVTGVYEDDENADGIADSRTINTSTYDPTITAEEIMIKSAVQKVAAPSNNSVFGAVLSHILVEYRSNEVSGEIAEYPNYRREESYTYTDEGKVLSYSYLRFYYNEEDGTLSESYSHTRTKTYDEDGKTIEESDSSSDDNDGDGVLDSSRSTICTMTYDSNGYLTSQSCTRTEDGGDPTVDEMTCTHTYTDGLLTQTTVTETGEQPYTLDFTYNEDGLVATKTKTSDNDVYRLAFTYDSEGRVISYTHRNENDYDGDDILNSVTEYLYTFSYDDSGRITEYSRQYRYDNTPATPEYSSNEIDTHIYSYTESGSVSSYSYTSQNDLDLDGEMDNVTHTRNYEFSYDNGSLVSISYDNEATGDYHEHSTQVLTYQDGLIKTSVWEGDDDNDGIIDDATTTEITYDASGRMSAYVETDYDGNYASVEETQAVALTYNADDTVTGTITTTSYGEGDPEVTTTPVSIDFSANGLPSGGMEFSSGSFSPDYCVTPSAETLLYYYRSDYIEEQSYLININIPKVLGILWNTSSEDN